MGTRVPLMRESPVVPPAVQLFPTCLGELVLPEAVADARALLERSGYEVVTPRNSVCCGQPAFNAGHRPAARRVARGFVRTFSPELPVVLPSGSCATMLAHYLHDLLPDAPRFEVWELSAFLARDDAASLARTNDGARLVYHDSCHMQRELGIHAQPRQLLEASGATLVPLPRPDLCCGFGGTFSVRQPEVSVALADDKLAGAAEADALVTADPGCLMHLRGRSERVAGPRVVHLATALARGARA
jgi:L-lactate dehydrogenase complex protein LldE